MRSVAATILRQSVPHALVFVAATLLLHYVVPPAATMVFAPLLAFAILVVSGLLAWRFRTFRVLLAVILLVLAERALAAAASGPWTESGRALANLLAVLLPINLALLSLVDDASFDLEAFGWWAGLVIPQLVIVAVLCRPELASLTSFLGEPLIRSIALPTRVPQIATMGFAVVAWIQLLRFLITRKPVDSGLFWAVCAGFVALHQAAPGFASAYFACAGVMLGAAVVETSYFIAYYDELTNLPGRRAFNQAIATLDDEYAIAIVDVDHFKKFNDTYGHDVGDQVLRMVASRLARVTGHGAAFRCGGEEFAIVFRKLTAEEALAHAELLRETIAESSFVLRGPDRSQRPRAERRQHHNKRRLRAESSSTSVTVSIGLASPLQVGTAVEDVIRAADQALYQAKDEGRNRVAIRQVRRTPKPRLSKRDSPVAG
jgi:diguanylate cyclase (GGDEF)-like protein